MAGKPIFPPEDLNYSAQALEASEALMDAETQALLVADRARLKQATFLGVFTLGQELGLSPANCEELQQRLVERLGNMSPVYHEYVNQLLGATASALMTQLGAEPVRVADTPEIHINGHASEADIITLAPNYLRQQDDRSPEAVSLNGSANGSSNGSHPHDELPTESESVDASNTISDTSLGDIDEAEVLAYNPEDILYLSSEDTFIEYSKVPANMKKVLIDLFPERAASINSLQPRVAALIMYQILETYSTSKIPHTNSASRAVQRNRIEQYTGLYGAPVQRTDIPFKLNVSHAAFYSGLRHVVTQLMPLIDEETIWRKASTTVEYGNVDGYFSPLPDVVIADGPSHSQAAEQQEAQSTPGSIQEDRTPIADEDRADAEENLGDDELQEFFDHTLVPTNMRNFILRVLPANTSDKIFDLAPWPASVLTHRLIEEYRGLGLDGARDATREKRCKWLEQWTGLYKGAQEIDEIAKRYVTGQQSVKTGIDNAMRQLEQGLTKEQLREMYEYATTRAYPRRSNTRTAVAY